ESDSPPAGMHAYTTLLGARLARVIGEEQIDLVHAHYAIPHLVSAVLARSALGSKAPPLVLTLHGSDVPTEPDAGLRLVLGELVRSAAAITVPSTSLANRAREQLAPDLRIEVL